MKNILHKARLIAVIMVLCAIPAFLSVAFVQGSLNVGDWNDSDQPRSWAVLLWFAFSFFGIGSSDDIKHK